MAEEQQGAIIGLAPVAQPSVEHTVSDYSLLLVFGSVFEFVSNDMITHGEAH